MRLKGSKYVFNIIRNRFIKNFFDRLGYVAGVKSKQKSGVTGPSGLDYER